VPADLHRLSPDGAVQRAVPALRHLEKPGQGRFADGRAAESGPHRPAPLARARAVGDGILLLDLVCLLALAGFVYAVKDRVSAIDIFCLVYVPCILLWPYRDVRYVLSVLLAVAFYAALGFRRLVFPRRPLLRHALAGVFLAWIAVAYFGSVPEGRRLAAEGISEPWNLELLDVVRSRTGHDELILCRKSRALSLLTGRPSVWYPRVGDRQLWWKSVCGIPVRCLVSVPGIFEDDQRILKGIIAVSGPGLRLVHHGAGFEVYAINREACGVMTTASSVHTES
jgi:hypothetical protein